MKKAGETCSWEMVWSGHVEGKRCFEFAGSIHWVLPVCHVCCKKKFGTKKKRCWKKNLSGRTWGEKERPIRLQTAEIFGFFFFTLIFLFFICVISVFRSSNFYCFLFHPWILNTIFLENVFRVKGHVNSKGWFTVTPIHRLVLQESALAVLTGKLSLHIPSFNLTYTGCFLLSCWCSKVETAIMSKCKLAYANSLSIYESEDRINSRFPIQLLWTST